jgi:Tfp pilus assembly protein PilO
MIGAFLLVWYRPLRQEMKLVRQAKAAQTLATAKTLAQSSQLSTLKEQLFQIRKSVGNYQAKVPDNRDLGAFLQQITDLMNRHDLKDQLIQPGDELKTEGFNCITVNMRGTGSFKQIFAFFESLQALDRLVRIQHVELLNDSDFSGNVTINADTVIYYQPDGGLG